MKKQDLIDRLNTIYNRLDDLESDMDSDMLKLRNYRDDVNELVTDLENEEVESDEVPESE